MEQDKQKKYEIQDNKDPETKMLKKKIKTYVVQIDEGTYNLLMSIKKLYYIHQRRRVDRDDIIYKALKILAEYEKFV